MDYTAFEARDVTGEVLLKDRSLMELWKWAADQGQIQAVQVKGKNYAVIKDNDLLEKIRAAAPGLKTYRYNEETEELSHA